MSQLTILICVALVACVPIIELKGAIPMGIVWAAAANIQINPWVFFWLAWIGSCLPVPIILFGLSPVLDWMENTKMFRNLSAKLKAKFNKKSNKISDNADTKTDKVSSIDTQARLRRIGFWKHLGVLGFVAIPLPLTGVWTGSAIAVFLKLNPYKAWLNIIIGNLIAGLIIMGVSLAGYGLFGIVFN